MDCILLEICRMKRVRVISIRDKIDSAGELFPETKICGVLDMFGALSLERPVSTEVVR